MKLSATKVIPIESVASIRTVTPIKLVTPRKLALDYCITCLTPWIGAYTIAKAKTVTRFYFFFFFFFMWMGDGGPNRIYFRLQPQTSHIRLQRLSFK